MDLLDDDDDYEVKSVKHPQIHAWLESYIADKEGIHTVSTMSLYDNYTRWISKNDIFSLMCNYQQFVYRLRCMSKKSKCLKFESSYVKGKGVVRTSTLNISSAKDNLWE